MRESETALSRAIGYERPVTREPRLERESAGLLEQAELQSACGDIVLRCRKLQRTAEIKRFVRDIWNPIPDPIELRCKGEPDGDARLSKVGDDEWRIHLRHEAGFGLGLINARPAKDPFLRISQIEANLAEREGLPFDGHMVMVPEPGREDTFREYFGISGDLPPHVRFNFEDDPTFAAEAVRQAMGQVHRPR